MSYANINGLSLYYELHGEANGKPPLVLLHGGGSTIETSFASVLPRLAQNRQVIAYEQQGHGHTTDVDDRPFTFEQSADDAAALLAHLGIAQADFFGYSNGASIALQVAIRHPRLARKLVVASGAFKRSGLIEGFFDGFAHASLENMPAELRDAYTRVSPHPEKLQSFHDKCVERMVNFKDWPEEQVRGITAATLIVIADRDVVRVEHGIEMMRLMVNAGLAVIPFTDHMQLCERWPVGMIEAFLEG